MASTNDLKNGMVLDLDHGLCSGTEFPHDTARGGGKDDVLENMSVIVAMHEGVARYVELPVSAEYVVAHTDPGLQGDRSTGGTKPATLETGAEIQVPLFLTTGEKIKVDTR